MTLPSEKARTAYNDGSREAAPCRRCPTPVAVVKVAITIDGTLTSCKGIWKLIFKSSFQMLLELVRAQQTNDISSQHRHYNKR